MTKLFSVCTHPPREWFRGGLLPCAHPDCPDGCVGDFYIIPLERTSPRSKPFTQKRFRRHEEFGPGGPVYTWEAVRT